MTLSLYEEHGYATAPETFEQAAERLKMDAPILTPDEIAEVLERFDQTEPSLQRKIVVHLVGLVTAAEVWKQQILALCRPISHSGVNSSTHDLAYKILKVLGDRP